MFWMKPKKKKDKIPFYFSDFMNGLGLFLVNIIGLTIEVFWFPAVLALICFLSSGGLDIMLKQ